MGYWRYNVCERHLTVQLVATNSRLQLSTCMRWWMVGSSFLYECCMVIVACLRLFYRGRSGVACLLYFTASSKEVPWYHGTYLLSWGHQDYKLAFATIKARKYSKTKMAFRNLWGVGPVELHPHWWGENYGQIPCVVPPSTFCLHFRPFGRGGGQQSRY